MSALSSESTKDNVVGTVNHHRSEPEAAVAALQLSDPLQLAGAKKQSNKDLLKHSTTSADAGEDKVNDSSNGLPPLGKATAFAQFVQQGWEAYMNDPNADAAFPLQLLCGASGGYDRLVGPYAPLPDGHLLAPAALRHTHSSPLKYGSPIFAQYGNDHVPPPIPLDPFQRSSSTPSSFRHRSTNSAFTDRVPSQRVSYTSVISKPDSRLSAFDPVKYYARALEDMERTSIEVTDVTPGKHGETDAAEASVATAEVNSRIGAAARAARFLSDVRMLRRRRRALGGRDNPATPASNSSSSGAGSSDSKEEESRALDTSVTVITEPNAPETSLMSQSSELSALLDHENESDETTKISSVVSETDRDIVKGPSSESEPYHRLDSDVDEEEIHFRSLYQSSESPGTVPSPAYVPMIDERVPGSERPSKPKTQEKSVSSVATSTPSPTRMNREGSPRSSDSANSSPGTRSSATGSSSGHTTHATLSTLSSGHHSGLSTISETDREVMQANSDGKRRHRGLDALRSLNNKLDPNPPAAEAEARSLNSSSTSTTSNPSGYIALANSPVPLREGANVPADRFFTHSPSNASALAPRSANRTTVPLRRTGQSGSPGTVETASESHTTLSGSNTDEVPPKFVSYTDREGASDLTSVREGVEVSTKRGDNDKAEEREDSPAEFVKYPELIFANSGATSPIPRPLSAKGQRYRTTRPPRTPTKGLLPRSTPPPRGAVSPLNQHSPPSTAVDHSTDRGSHTSSEAPDSVPADESLVASSPQPDGPLLYIPGGNASPTNYKDDEFHGGQVTRAVRGRTYADGSVEILKATSPNASPPTLVTPEKNVD